MSKASRLLTIILWVILAISAVLVVSLMANISDNPADANMGGWINNNIAWSYILLIVATGSAILFSLFHMLSDLKAAKKGLLSLLVFAIVAILSYTLASDTIPQFIGVDKFIADGSLTPVVAKFVDTGLIATYILLGLSVVAIIWSSVSQVFR